MILSILGENVQALSTGPALCELFSETLNFLCIPGETVVSYACFLMKFFMPPFRAVEQ